MNQLPQDHNLYGYPAKDELIKEHDELAAKGLLYVKAGRVRDPFVIK